ncbi:MAG: PD-(D/E)XK nuclease family protein [Planctomycetota bacterium]
MSASKTEGWFRCQFQWFLIRVLGWRRPPAVMMAAGRSLDSVAESYYGIKIDLGTDLTESETLEAWREAWERESGEVEDWSRSTDTKDDMTDKGVLVVSRWREKIATQILPTTQKLWFELLLDKGDQEWTLNGEVDLLHQPLKEQHRKPIAADTKLSGKRYSAKQAYSSLQPPIYALALEHSPDVESDPSRFQFHVGILYNPNTKRTSSDPAQIVTRMVSPEERVGVLARVAMARRQIKHAFETGDFLPNRLSQTCSRRYCAFWEECEKRFGPRVPD